MDKVGESVPQGVARVVEDDEIVLVGERTQPAPRHLEVEREGLRRASHRDARHARHVEAVGKKLDVADDGERPLAQPTDDVGPFGGGRFGVYVFGVYTSGAKRVPQVEGRLDPRRVDDRGPAIRQLLPRRDDVPDDLRFVHEYREVAPVVVARGCTDSVHVGPRGAENARRDEVLQGDQIARLGDADDLFVDLTEAATVQPFRGRSEPDDDRGREPLDQLLRHIQPQVCFVQEENRGRLDFPPRECRRRGHLHRVVLGMIRLQDDVLDPGACQFVGGLLDDFVSRCNEDSTGPMSNAAVHDLPCDTRLARPCRRSKDDPFPAILDGSRQGVDRARLIVAQRLHLP